MSSEKEKSENTEEKIMIENMSEFIDVYGGFKKPADFETVTSIIDKSFIDITEDDLLPYFKEKYSLNSSSEVLEFFKSNSFEGDDLHYFKGLRLVI